MERGISKRAVLELLDPGGGLLTGFIGPKLDEVLDSLVTQRAFGKTLHPLCGFKPALLGSSLQNGNDNVFLLLARGKFVDGDVNLDRRRASV